MTGMQTPASSPSRRVAFQFPEIPARYLIGRLGVGARPPPQNLAVPFASSGPSSRFVVVLLPFFAFGTGPSTMVSTKPSTLVAQRTSDRILLLADRFGYPVTLYRPSDIVGPPRRCCLPGP